MVTALTCLHTQKEGKKKTELFEFSKFFFVTSALIRLTWMGRSHPLTKITYIVHQRPELASDLLRRPVPNLNRSPNPRARESEGRRNSPLCIPPDLTLVNAA